MQMQNIQDRIDVNYSYANLKYFLKWEVEVEYSRAY